MPEEGREFAIDESAMTKRVDIKERLDEKYPNHLRPDIVEVSIVHLRGVSFLEITSRPYEHMRDEVVERMDLSFISDGENEMFPADNPVADNADRFMEKLDPYSIIMTTNLFSEEAASAVAAEWEAPGGRLSQERNLGS